MLKITNIRVGIDSTKTLEAVVAHRLNIPMTEVLQVDIIKKSVDARKKQNICIVYALAVAVQDEISVWTRFKHDRDVEILKPVAVQQLTIGTKQLRHRPVVVGAGPAGLLAGYLLAKYGFAPLIIERGSKVDKRSADVERFWQQGILDEESNVQFGEGGAGTFSDGKLTTRIKAEAIGEILKILVECGAPEDILYKHKPHIGTDVLKTVVSKLSERIVQLGATMLFDTKVTDIRFTDGQVTGITLSDGQDVATELLLLGIGHSAADTYRMLAEHGVAMQAKPLAIGVRIEHTQSFINKLQYRAYADDAKLEAADYMLTYQDQEAARGAYSFCMCPGGLVVASSSRAGQVVTNGMSYRKRDGNLANAALVVTVDERDYGEGVLAVLDFQQKYERLAYMAGGSDYRAPAQSVKSFLNDTEPELQVGFVSSYLPGVKAARLSEVLPLAVTQTLRKALRNFEIRLPGFTDKALLVGVETRTSAPVRILRTSERQSENMNGLYPIGEGAGYAGGIISAAADGYNTAAKIISGYSLPQ